MANSETVIVIGAGIVGVCTAIWLQRAGFKVTLVDREGVASGTPFGNAGVLASSTCVPVTMPGIVKKAPFMLFDKDQPLFLRWSYLLKAAPFLVRYLSYSRVREVERISAGIASLMHDSADQHFAVAKGTGAERYLKATDYVHLFKDKASFEADAAGWKLRRDNGFTYEELGSEALAEYDPALAGKFGFAVRCPDHGQITDPGKYTEALAEHFVDEGGKLEIATVTDFVVQNGSAVGISTDKGKMDAAHFVITSGVWSDKLCAKLGLKVPMESERGYHLEFTNPNISLRSPVMVTSGKFAVNSMEGRLRCAGIVEFGGVNAPPSKAPFEFLKRHVHALFPELEYDALNEWMGHRPSTADSLPLIGPLKQIPNVWAGFGHQHLGLTGGPKTGRWLAQMMSGESPNTNLEPYQPNRF